MRHYRKIWHHVTDCGNEWKDDFEISLEAHLARVGLSDGFTEFVDKAQVDQLQKELAEAREENEQLMNVEYWPDRCKIAEKEVAQLKGQNICDVCCGDATENCMCNGTGRMSEAVYYLRPIVNEQATLIAEMTEALEYYAKGNFPSYTKDGVEPGTVARNALAKAPKRGGA